MLRDRMLRTHCRVKYFIYAPKLFFTFYKYIYFTYVNTSRLQYWSFKKINRAVFFLYLTAKFPAGRHFFAEILLYLARYCQ